MEKVNYTTKNLLKQKIEIIKEWYPSVIQLNEQNEEIINYNALKIAMELDSIITEDKTERYMMNWPDKNKTIANANLPIDKVLRPLIEKSVDFFNTENIYIEGDNLDALKIIYNSYLAKVNVIYIDPPYNTGNDFIYKDNFSQTSFDAAFKEGLIDEFNNKLVQNSRTDGRFHTNWLNMIYPRLKIARDLLTDDGIIFISIDDNEQANLKKICDDIFGEENFIAILKWIRNPGGQSDNKHIAKTTEYILFYSKNKDQFQIKNLREKQNVQKNYIYDEKNKYWYKKGLQIEKGGSSDKLSDRPNLGYTIYYNENNNNIKINYDYDKTKINGSLTLNDEIYKYNLSFINDGYIPIIPRSVKNTYGRWRMGADKVKQYFLENKLIFQCEHNNCRVFEKEIIYDDDPFKYKKPKDIIDFCSSKTGTDELSKIFSNEETKFEYPKPTALIKYLINFYNKENILVLDFFSGSATTAHSIIELNNENSSNIKYILIQINENIKEKNIVDLAQTRIKRISDVMKKNSNNSEIMDLGFRVFKIDSDNIVNNQNYIEDINQDLFMNLSNNFETIKSDRNNLDLVFESILDCGLTLDKKIQIESFEDNTTFYNIDNNFIICCFEDKIDNIDFIKHLSNLKPTYIYFKENSFKTDQIKINLEEIFKNNSSDTTIKIF